MEQAMREVERVRALRFQGLLERKPSKPKKLSAYFAAQSEKPSIRPARRPLKTAA